MAKLRDSFQSKRLMVAIVQAPDYLIQVPANGEQLIVGLPKGVDF
ncbi:Unknown protein sequence [Pseudomonas savastanoi pv. phaseolicola]|uniref:Uncharacterized protein n=1 Tax=Pseudomonas savastanoi pv. phaseolicola TaxID=319 RepID=A0ABD4B9L7_PSESH|nr:Unknown protein sequence [Pseudomonas savastanoi pv. phaseolicola]